MMIKPAPGVLLIAEPFLKDPNFSRTVVFVCDHNQQGSFGFVLNRLFEHSLDELMHNAEGLNIPVFYGGPVQMDTIHFLHRYPDKIPGGYEVTNGIFWGGDFELAVELIKAGEIDTNGIRFYIGYSGWAEGQLDDELTQKSWLTLVATRRLVFLEDSSEIWKESVKELGGDYSLMINFPTDPRLN